MGFKPGYKVSEETKAKMRARVFSDEHKAAISKAKLGKKFTDEHRAALAVAREGRRLSEEHKANIGAAVSKALTGRKLSDEHRAAIGAAKMGKTTSDETKIKLSNAMKGRPGKKGKKLWPSQIAALVASHEGKNLTEEHKKKISRSNSGKIRSAEIRHASSISAYIRSSNAKMEALQNALGDLENYKAAKLSGSTSDVTKIRVHPLKGRVCYTDGRSNKLCFESPGEGWIPGKIKKPKGIDSRR
jgi:hypothetical protein